MTDDLQQRHGDTQNFNKKILIKLKEKLTRKFTRRFATVLSNLLHW